MLSLENSLWAEKYRPDTISNCILPATVKSEAIGMIANDSMTHLILSGPSGTGKTSLARAMCNELGCEYVMYNGSSGELNLDELRENVREFSATVSMNGTKGKVIIIDEADGLGHLIQPALRHAMEKYSNVRFILTCNYPDKIMPALKSRCAEISYKFQKDEQNMLIREFAHRVIQILDTEKIEYDIEAIKGVCLKFFPDNRKILNELQKHSNSQGVIDISILNSLTSKTENLFSAINDKNFDDVKHWIANNNVENIFNTLFKECEKYIKPDMIPLFIIKLGDYQRYHGTVPNQELNLLAALTEYMAESA